VGDRRRPVINCRGRSVRYFVGSHNKALSYYYEHIEAMREYERADEAAFDDVRDSSLKPNA